MNKMDIHHNVYRKENGFWLIEMHLNKLSQLFNTFDPAPFHERDLDPDAEDYIVSTATDLGLKSPTRLVIYLPETELIRENPSEVQEAIHYFFRYKEASSRRELRRVLRNGRTSLIIGILFLTACVNLPTIIPEGMIRLFLEHWLIICGWVAMWHPVEVYLYQWWPIRATIRIFNYLSRIEIILLSDSQVRR